MKTRDITIYGVYAAIFLFMSLTPFIGFIKIGPFAITTLYIPLVVMTIHLKWKGALVGGFYFGITSLFYGLTYGASIFAFVGYLDAIIIVVGSRIILGIAVALIVIAIDKLNIVWRVNIIIISILAINHIAFMGLLVIFSGDGFWFIFTAVSLNTAIEWPAMIIISNALYPLYHHLLKEDDYGY